MSSERVADPPSGSTRLLLARAPDGAVATDCQSHLADDGAPLDVVHVTYTRSAEEIVAAWAESTVPDPESLHVVQVRERMVEETPDVAAAGAVSVVTVNPNDLTGLAMRLQDALRSLDRSDRAAVCFESVTALLQYADDQSAYKFLHTLTGQLHDVDARAHFHLNPEAYDDKVVNSMASVFDAATDLDAVSGDD